MTLNFQLVSERLILLKCLENFSYRSWWLRNLTPSCISVLCWGWSSFPAVKRWCFPFFNFPDLISVCLDFLLGSILPSMLLSSPFLFLQQAHFLVSTVLAMKFLSLPIQLALHLALLSTSALLTGPISLPDNPPHLSGHLYLLTTLSRGCFLNLLLDSHIKSLIPSQGLSSLLFSSEESQIDLGC